MGVNIERLMTIKQEWEEIMKEFSDSYQIELNLQTKSPFLRYFLYVEGHTCQFILIENKDGVHFIEQDNQKDSFTLPYWEKEVARASMGNYLETIKKRRRIKNMLKPPTYFFNQAMDKLTPYIENPKRLEETKQYVLENLLTRYTSEQIEKKSKEIRKEEIGFYYYLHNTNFVLFHFIDTYFLLKEERYKQEIKDYATQEEAENKMQEKIGEVIKEQLDKRNIWRT